MKYQLWRSALAVVVVMGAGCGGDESKDDGDPDTATEVDASTIDAANIDASPGVERSTYVISAVNLPSGSAEGQTLGFDIDGKPNDGIDNQLGSFVGSLSALAPGLDQEAMLAVRISRGDVVTLVEVTTPADVIPATEGTVSTFIAGATITPLPCTDGADTACGHHLDGTGTFTIDTTAPAGTHTDGTFTGGALTSSTPGDLPIELALAGGDPFTVTLHGARVQLAELATAGFNGSGSKLGGAITVADLDARVKPAVASGARATFAAQCTVGGTPPGCGCVPANGTGAMTATLYDKSPKDCTITDAEVSTVISGFLTPDIDLDGDGTNDALSIGIGITGVRATFPAP